MKDIAIYGAGGFGRELLTLIQNINSVKLCYNIVGFFDDGHPKGEMINGFPVLGNVDDLNNWDKKILISIAIGNPLIKSNIIKKIINTKVSFPTLIHPNVIIGDIKYVQIGIGSIICAGNIITTNIKIGDFVILNLSSTVGHDSVIGNYSSFMPTVNISGEVEIGEGVYVGTGAKIINQISIGMWTTVGAGAVVTKALPPHCTAVGVPAKVIKFEEN